MKKPVRKRRLSSSQRRLEILEAAVPLFSRDGFRGVTTKQVATEAGVSEALLYQHFPSKEVLYTEVQSYCCQVPESLHLVINALVPSSLTLVQLLYFFLNVVLEEPSWAVIPSDHFSRLMLNSCLEDGNFARLHFQKTARPLLDKMVLSFQAARHAGDLLPDELPDDLRFWLCHHVVVTLQLYQLPTPPVITYSVSELAQIKRHTLLYMLRGLGLRPEAVAKYFDLEQLESAVKPWLASDAEKVTDPC